MSELLYGGTGGVMLCSFVVSPMWVNDNTITNTFSLGDEKSGTHYAGVLRRGRFSNNYVLSPDWGITTYFSWLNGNPIDFDSRNIKSTKYSCDIRL